MNIIFFSGYKGSGKDYVAKILMKYYPQFHKVAIANELKNFVSKEYSIDREIFDDPYRKDLNFDSTRTYRDLLVYHAEKAKEINPVIWIEKAVERIKNDNLQNVIITDWRFPIELEHIVKEFPDAKIILVRITNKYLGIETSYSETCLDNFNFQVRIDNSVYKDEAYVINQLREKIIKNI